MSRKESSKEAKECDQRGCSRRGDGWGIGTYFFGSADSKGFKFFVLELQILKGLRQHFTDLQIVKDLAGCATDFTKKYSAKR